MPDMSKCFSHHTNRENPLTLYFMIEEIGYYYAPFVHQFKNELTPIFEAGKRVMQEIEHIQSSLPSKAERAKRWTVEAETLKTHYGYLFE